MRPLYDLCNKSLKQFGYWHKDYSIDEQKMIPYFGMHSAKQTMRNKATRFGYKNFVLTSSNGYPYHITPYGGAKGIAGTSGKDLTSRVVIDFALETKCFKTNLAFDNWYASTKLLSLLNTLEIPTVCTARADRIGNVPLTSVTEMKNMPRGSMSYAFDKMIGLHCVRWIDNSIVTSISNCIGPYPVDKVERYSRKEKKKIQVDRPKLLKTYNQSMGRVDLLDSAVATYRPCIKGKKWWWPHFVNQLGVLVAAAWQIHRVCNPNEDQTLLYFIRSICRSYLHTDVIVPGPTPQHWKTKVLVGADRRLTGRSHWPNQRNNQRHCAFPGCKSRPKTYCEECDVALCIKDHFKIFHTAK